MINPKNILIVRTDRIGDVVLTLPMAKILKNVYPDSKVTFLVRDYTKALPESNQFIDETILLPSSNNSLDFFELYSLLKLRKFDTAIMVYPRFSITLAVFLAGIKQRIGSGYRFFSFLFTDKIYEHRRSGDKHELEYNLNLLKPFRIDNVDKESVSFDIQVNSETEHKVDKILQYQKIPFDKKIIIIHPGSGGSSIDLPISKFISLSNRLAQELDCSIVITGSKYEVETCNRFINGKNQYNLAGLLTLEELTAMIMKSEILIANSTGPIHIAAALGKNVVGFYPKINECSVERWGPFTKKKLIYSPTIGCTNCTRKQCEQLDCMNSINIDEVFSGIAEILNEAKNG
jgi:ADP-heptose:LPS heptosyltransferase